MIPMTDGVVSATTSSHIDANPPPLGVQLSSSTSLEHVSDNNELDVLRPRNSTHPKRGPRTVTYESTELSVHSLTTTAIIAPLVVNDSHDTILGLIPRSRTLAFDPIFGDGRLTHAMGSMQTGYKKVTCLHVPTVGQRSHCHTSQDGHQVFRVSSFALAFTNHWVPDSRGGSK